MFVCFQEQSFWMINLITIESLCWYITWIGPILHLLSKRLWLFCIFWICYDDSKQGPIWLFFTSYRRG